MLILRICILMMLPVAVLAGDEVVEPDSAHPATPLISVGEVITYKIYWGILPVGFTVATTEWIEEDGKKLVAIRFRTKSNSVIEKVYPVDDLIESIVDPETLLPIRFVKKLSEGRYRTDETTVFDHEKGTAHLTSIKRDGRVVEKDYAIHEDTRDLVSFMYYMRSKPLSVGDEQHLEVMSDEKLYDLFLKVPKKEKVGLEKYGKLETLRVEPQAKFQGLFVRSGKMTLWITPGEHSYMAKMAAKVPVASVNILLYKVEGTGSGRLVEKTKRKRRSPRSRWR